MTWRSSSQVLSSGAEVAHRWQTHGDDMVMNKQSHGSDEVDTWRSDEVSSKVMPSGAY